MRRINHRICSIVVCQSHQYNGHFLLTILRYIPTLFPQSVLIITLTLRSWFTLPTTSTALPTVRWHSYFRQYERTSLLAN